MFIFSICNINNKWLVIELKCNNDLDIAILMFCSVIDKRMAVYRDVCAGEHKGCNCIFLELH